MKIGDFVEAHLADGGQSQTRRGVYVCDFGDGIIGVQGESAEIYHCLRAAATVIPEDTLGEAALAYFKAVRN